MVGVGETKYEQWTGHVERERENLREMKKIEKSKDVVKREGGGAMKTQEGDKEWNC